MSSQFDPFATQPSDVNNTVKTDSTTTTTKTMTTPEGGGMAVSSSLVGKNIQFKSSLQAKQDAIKAEQEKQQQQLLMQQQQQQLLEQQRQQQQRDAFSSLGNDDAYDKFGTTIRSDEDDPFAGLSCMPNSRSNARKQSASYDTQKSDDEENSDDDRQIPLPEDRVLYQAQEAALYAEEILNEQANNNRSDKALSRLWNSAQGLFTVRLPVPVSTNCNTDETAKKETTTCRTGENPKPKQCSVGTTRVTPASSTPLETVPFPGGYTHNLPNQSVYTNNTASQASYANAPSPAVVHVPRPANWNNLDSEELPWYARSTTDTSNPQTAVSNDQQQNSVPWYARSPPPDGFNISVDDVEYSGRHGGTHEKVPWYSRGNPGVDDTRSRESRRSSSPSPSSSTRGGIGSGVGASVLGGVVGLVALGPLAAVAAAGGLAYASAKDGMVGDVVRGAGGAVATAVSAAAAATKKKPTTRRDNI